MRFSPIHRNIAKMLDLKSMKALDHFCQYNPSPLTLRQFIEFGRTANEKESYQFVTREVPVRVANIMKEINLLPANLLQMPSMIDLQEAYAKTFMELCTFEGQPGERHDLDQFVKALKAIQTRHSNVVQKMARGVMELQESHAIDSATEASIQYFLDRFYMSRISTRMLLNQHWELFNVKAGDPEPQPNRVGVIDTECNVASIAKDAYRDAAIICEEYYCFVPDIDLDVVNQDGSEGKKVQLAYPPTHLYHILFELFKNSMRATIESRDKTELFELPSIKTLIVSGPEDVTIKISDQGGGIPRKKTEALFLYLYSTAPRPDMEPEKAPLAGYGFGLPLSRLYARYFHGELVLNSYEGYGTDAVLYLKRKLDDSVELLPIFNKTSTKQYRLSTPSPDWTDPMSAINRTFVKAAQQT